MIERKGGLILLGLGIVCVTSAFVYFAWDYFPGTYRRDENGFSHGTGTERYFYKSGRLKLEERYRAGEVVHSTWYRPDGSVLDSREWQNGTGDMIYVRDDGSIRTRMPFVNGAAEGKTIHYNPDGSVQREQWYSRGQPVATQSTTASAPG